MRTEMERNGARFSTVGDGALAVVGAFVLAILCQTPLLRFFYWAIPGEKTSDGPIFVLLAYVLAPIAAFLGFAFLRNRVTRSRRLVIGLAMGPAVMAIVAAFCGWAARMAQ
jgi:hypothetical protein